MDWTELTIPNPPPTENVEFDRWLNNLTKHLRNYLGGLILNDDIANDAGDTAAWDFELGDLTTDGTWYDLDLSGTVPAGAKAVFLHVTIVDNAVGSWINFRENGNSNNYNRSLIRTQIADVGMESDILVFCDSSRVIEYSAANVTFTSISIAIKGWLM